MSNRLVSIYSLYGQLDQAIALWQHTSDIDPNYLPAQLNLADAYKRSNQAAKAVPIYNLVQKKDPQNPYTIAGLAKAAIATDRWTDAKALLEDAELNIRVGIGENLLVSIYEHLGETTKSRAIRSRAKSTDSYIEVPDPWLDQISEYC
ncbi:tetratricopeptide repeat protein [Pelagicoccus sp. SDUM812002]|uniref:tetratricopeptide repeat protein n=1 Tax=Pelagicoccus sp. SDUM812002 TaxID=3041266 RepID=UPI00280F42EA|nr:tetratricopeptide repeat protein [Pelagicoccus sp. SDUM812002]MDQ8184225.1 tetratricopeptide repeat protein [Pelagicoccus sp. SDUM812002]